MCGEVSKLTGNNITIPKIYFKLQHYITKFILDKEILITRPNYYNQIEENACRTPEKHVLAEFLRPVMNADQLLKTFSSIIHIPSIVIEFPGEADYNFINIQKVLTMQISRQKWKEFFKVLSGFNFMNFDVMEWIKGDTKGKLNLDEESYERSKDEKVSWEWFKLRTGKSSQVWIDAIERIIRKLDKCGYLQLQFNWMLICGRVNQLPPFIRETYIAGASEIFRKLEVTTDQGKEMVDTRTARKYRVVQEVENYNNGKYAKTILVLNKEEELEIEDNYKEMMDRIRTDIYRYGGCDNFKEDTNREGRKYILVREDAQEYNRKVEKILKEDKQDN
jgi:hypothetical protein